ncbi:MAG: hypothetical protein KA781_08545 [Aquabacterium sp.]|nr:hypothetical protein [Aquabacterium sp.]
MAAIADVFVDKKVLSREKGSSLAFKHSNPLTHKSFPARLGFIIVFLQHFFPSNMLLTHIPPEQAAPDFVAFSQSATR